MMSPTRLHHLRLSLERLAHRQLREAGLICPPMQAFLAVPLTERLILLAKADGADDKEIKRLLKATDEDVAVTSPRMEEDIKNWKIQSSTRRRSNQISY